MSKLVIIETSDIGAASTAQAAIRLGFEPLFVCDLDLYQADTRREIEDYPYINTNTTSVEHLIASLADYEIGGVITFLDSRLHVATELAQQLGVPGLDPKLIPLKDKKRVRDQIPEYSPETILFSPRQIPIDDINSWLEQRRSVVIKPCQAAGAIGTLILKDPTDQDFLAKHISETTLSEHLAPQRWLAQEFLEGELFSAEGWIAEGAVHLLGLTGRRKVGHTESIATFPDDDDHAPEIRNQVLQALSTLVSRSDLRFGYFHVEFISDGQRALVIDANLGRIGGGGVADLIAMSLGLDSVDVFEHVIAVSILNQNRDLKPRRSQPVNCTSICYGLRDRSYLLEIYCPEGDEIRHTQLLDCHQEIPPMGLNNWSWVGIATGPSQTVFRTVDRFQLITREGEMSACY